MQVETLLRDIENKDLVLPEFQRGFVWKEEDVKKFIQSLFWESRGRCLLVALFFKRWRRIFFILTNEQMMPYLGFKIKRALGLFSSNPLLIFEKEFIKWIL